MTAATSTTTTEGMVGGYLMDVDEPHLTALASNAATLPINRISLAFLNPTMFYEEGSNTLVGTGLESGFTENADGGFATLKSSIETLQSGGVDVYLSMGGWNWNCWPYAYAYYSVGGYGTATPNYYKIEAYGTLADCDESNQFCMVCEPPSEGTTLDDFAIFPQPTNSSSWQDAVSYVEGAAGGASPVWLDLVPGSAFTDSATGISTTVPGSSKFLEMGRNPYEDIASLASDLGATGIDLDYEEMWYADMTKTGTDPGPYILDQAVYKYAAIAKNLMTAIAASSSPSLRLSTAAAACGAWQGDWWGGNLKGVMYFTQKWYPEVIEFMTTGDNAGGLNVMTYDLSSNQQYHECPDDNSCPLDKQVDFYMDTYKQAGMAAAVGYELYTPAYPDPEHDQEHQLPLTVSELSTIETGTQATFDGGFFWSLYKESVDTAADYATADEVAQSICRAVLGEESKRCTGKIPQVGGSDDDDATGNVCDDDASVCNTCTACCHSYLDGASCDACFDSECAPANVCDDDASVCNTCAACCHSYLDGDSCDACFESEC